MARIPTTPWPSSGAWPGEPEKPLPQTRLHFTAEAEPARRAFARLEAEFEEDGLPLAIFAADEEERLHEVSVYVEGETGETERRILSALSELNLRVELAREALDDIDWAARALEGLKPVRAGRFLVHGSHDRHARRSGDIAIEIEAGLAFGTGHHGTTAGCLETIERVIKRRRPLCALDLGTGSAVLAIAIARLARIPVLATDIDPLAVRVARANARLNGVERTVHAETARGFDHPLIRAAGPFDLIVANILAGPLMRLAPEMARHIAPGGEVILSGILARQRNAVLAAYVGQRFRHLRTTGREGWVTMHLAR